MKLWIIGSKGFVGSTLLALCRKKQIDTVATSHDEADIVNLDHLKQFSQSAVAKGITNIINCAAYTNVDNAEKEADLAFSINALGAAHIGMVANDLRAQVIHISTDYVFSGKENRPYTETDTCAPQNIYGKTKWEGEKKLLNLCPKACIVRTSWVFGRGRGNFLSSILEKMQREKEVHVVSDQRGRPTFVNDLAEILLLMLPQSGIYHFANESEASRFEMAEKLYADALTLDIPLACKKLIPVASDFFPTRVKRPPYSTLNTEKISTLLGQKPRPWESALKEYLENL